MAVVVDDRSALDVGATVVAVPVWPGEGDAGPWVGEGAADLHALGVNLLGALERDKASVRAAQVVTVPVSGLLLQRLAGDVPWAHLDIAGPGRRRRARGREGWHGFRRRALLYWLETAQPADLANREISRAAGASRRR